MYIFIHVEYQLFLSDFNETWILFTDLRKIFRYQISWIVLSSVRLDIQTWRSQWSHFAILRMHLKCRQMKYFWNACRILPRGTGSAMRWRWRKNTAARWHVRRSNRTAAERVAVCWSWNFHWTPMHVHTYLSKWVLSSDMREIYLAPNRAERNYVVSQGVSVLMFSGSK
jgi:hypothetical protein